MNSWVAAGVGGAVGAFAVYLFAGSPVPVLMSLSLGGIIAAACYGWVLRQRLSPGRGAVLGFQAGTVMSALCVIWTLAVTGVGHYEFAASVTFIPVLICVLSVLGGMVTAFFIVKSQASEGA